MIINVTKENISSGTKNDCTYCPIALAVRYKIENNLIYNGCLVFGETVEVFDDILYSKIKIYKLPKIAIEAIKEFDKPNGKMIPFKFKLGNPKYAKSI